MSLFVASAVFGEVQVSLLWQVHYKYKCHFSWQVQYLVMLEYHFLWQGQHLVKVGMVAGARMLVRSVKSNLGCKAGCGRTVSCSDHARIMPGSFSDHLRIMVGSFP